jgi:hypothetical protein
VQKVVTTAGANGKVPDVSSLRNRHSASYIFDVSPTPSIGRRVQE